MKVSIRYLPRTIDYSPKIFSMVIPWWRPPKGDLESTACCLDLFRMVIPWWSIGLHKISSQNYRLLSKNIQHGHSLMKSFGSYIQRTAAYCSKIFSRVIPRWRSLEDIFWGLQTTVLQKVSSGNYSLLSWNNKHGHSLINIFRSYLLRT